MMLALLNITEFWEKFVTPERVSLTIRVVLILLIGIPVVKLIRKITVKLMRDKLSAQAEQLIQRTVYYLGMLILFVSVLNEFGFKLSALLGAAGVFGLAIGFASQTSVSNIISGIFLISEKPFVIGDVVQIGGNIGTVESIDLLSIKLKTADNRFVRVPNETMIKSDVINITRYPQRRVNITVSVAYKEDLRKVRSILEDIVLNEPLALKDPAPVINIDEFASSSINFLFGVWTNSADFFTTKNALMLAIKERFDRESIEIPFPHVSVYAGEVTKPFNIQKNAKEV
ncbi:MAG: mechanosensitive ion channel family protein [Candidatus Cloacimonetes bacterium]|nr:mechanosensitive ion channel family protein [Candidatus Cloacimonadota bacterium]